MNEKEAEYVKRCWDIEKTSDRKKSNMLQQPEGNLTGNGTRKVLVGDTEKITPVKIDRCLDLKYQTLLPIRMETIKQFSSKMLYDFNYDFKEHSMRMVGQNLYGMGQKCGNKFTIGFVFKEYPLLLLINTPTTATTATEN